MTVPRLTGDEAREVRLLRAVGFTLADLSSLYKISQSAVSKLIHGESYAWAPGPVEPRVPLAGREPPGHGTPGRYGGKWKCRCPECRAANAARGKRDRNRRLREAALRLARHG